MALTVETKAWKVAYGRSLNERYRSSTDHIVQFVADNIKKLSRPIKVHAYMYITVGTLSTVSRLGTTCTTVLHMY